MKRLLTGLFVAAMTLATLTPIADAHSYGRSGWYQSRYRFDPVYRALERGERITLNNYFDGHGYRSARRLLLPRDVRLLHVDMDGTYRIWFRGNVYSAYVRPYRDKLCLYLGNAPTRPGYRFELVLG